MFTGIIEETGRVQNVVKTGKGVSFVVQARICARGTRVGDSIAVNGCCLTAAKISSRKTGQQLYFDLLEETWNRTNLHCARVGAAVNLERALPAQGRVSGHFVTGHIDATGKIIGWERAGADWRLEVAAPPEIMRYLLFKGSIAVDGISLTVARVRKKSFLIWIIPHTWQVTALRERAVGDLVNLEPDILGKYVEKFLHLNKSKQPKKRSRSS